MKAKVRPLEMNDLDEIMKWVNDPEVIGKFTNFKRPMTRKQEATYLEQIIASEKDQLFAVETESGDYLGNIGLHDINYNTRSGRLAIILGNKKYWGKGYAQSTVEGLLEHAFEKYHLHKVWAIVMEPNKKMQHILEKCGFKKEGLLRDEYFSQGKYHNMVRMSILEKEYKIKYCTKYELMEVGK